MAGGLVGTRRAAWSVIVPKVLVDRPLFGFLGDSWLCPLPGGRCLAIRGQLDEWNWDFLTERMLPILVTNWMF